jgi:hypothetical protein
MTSGDRGRSLRSGIQSLSSTVERIAQERFPHAHSVAPVAILLLLSPVLGVFGARVQADEQIPGLGLSSPPEMATRPFAGEPFKLEAGGRVIRRDAQAATESSSLDKISGAQ